MIHKSTWLKHVRKDILISPIWVSIFFYWLSKDEKMLGCCLWNYILTYQSEYLISLLEFETDFSDLWHPKLNLWFLPTTYSEKNKIQKNFFSSYNFITVYPLF